MSSTQPNLPRGTSATDKADHKSTLDGGLKMKIMRSKSTDSGSSASSGSSGGTTEPKHKISKNNDSNGLQTSSESSSGQQSSSAKKHKESSKSGLAASRQSDSDDSSNPSNTGEGNQQSVKMPTTTFSAENMPLSNLFATQTGKYPSYSYAGYASSNRATNQFESLDISSKNGAGGGGYRNVQSLRFDGGKNESANNKKRKCSTGAMVDQCVGTSFGTMTEPECLGPCEPGTSVNLDGIVWHETADGILVVNATWRGRSYVGTLLDSTRHDWAPPKPNDGNEEWDSRTRAGRAKRRSAAYDPSSPLNSKLRSNNHKGRGAAAAAGGGGGARDEITGATANSAKRSASPHPDLRKSKDGLPPPPPPPSNDGSGNPNQQTLVNPVTGLQVEITNNNRQTIAPCPVSPILLECSEPNCNKKYKNAHGLRYHQSRVHGAECMDEDSRQSVETVTSESRKSPHSVTEDHEQNGLPMTNGLENGSPAPGQQEGVKGVVKNGEEDSEGSKIGADQVCDNESLPDTKGKSNVNGISSNSVGNSHSYAPNNILSVKKDLFDPPEAGEKGTNGIKSEADQLQNSISIFSRDGTRSPAYSDISDDSASFSNSEFIDKFLKSTDCKNSQDGSSMPLSNNLANAYPPTQQHQGFNIPTPSFASAPPQSLYDTNQIQTNTQPLSGPPLITPGGNMPATTSSTFINPYNLLNSSYPFNDDKLPTMEDCKTGENANIFPSKKDESASHKTLNTGDEGQGPISDTKQPCVQTTPEKSTTIGKDTFQANIMPNMPTLNNSQQGSPPDIKNIKIEPKHSAEQEQKQPNAERNHKSQTSSGPDAGQRASPKEDKKNRPPSQQPPSNQKSTTPSPRPPSNPANVQQQQTSPFNNDPYKNPNPASWNLKNEKTLKIKQEPQANIQQQQPSPFNNDPYKNPNPANWNLKDEKPLKIKQEPQVPQQPMARPPGPPQYLPQNQYMQPNYNFPAYSQYQSFNSPYYPRFSMPPDQTKNSIGPPPFSQNPSAFSSSMGNYTTQNTLSGFPGTQAGSNPVTAIQGNMNSPNPAQRVDPSRIPGVTVPGRPPQTHFHTHHHTHVGLGYPMYSGSYENSIVPGQQGAATTILSPYSPRPTK